MTPHKLTSNYNSTALSTPQSQLLMSMDSKAEIRKVEISYLRSQETPYRISAQEQNERRASPLTRSTVRLQGWNRYPTKKFQLSTQIARPVFHSTRLRHNSHNLESMNLEHVIDIPEIYVPVIRAAEESLDQIANRFSPTNQCTGKEI